MDLFVFDSSLLNFLFSIRTTTGVQFFSVVTMLFSPIMIGIILAVVALVYGFQKQHRTAVLFFVGYLVTELFVLIGKVSIHRSRPDTLFQAVTETSFSLPSGHAASVAYLIGILLYLFFCAKKPSVWIKFLLIVPGVFLVLLVDLSRLYLGVHYLSDVVVGNILGLFVCFLTIRILRQKKL